MESRVGDVDSKDEQARIIAQKAFEERINERDVKYPDPSKRAGAVLQYLRSAERFTTWDCMCFAVEFMALMLPTWSWLDPEIRSLVRKVYTVHYSMDEEGLKAYVSQPTQDNPAETRTES